MIMTNEEKLNKILNDIDPSATILIALSEDRKTLHAYGTLEEEGREKMVLALNSDSRTRKGVQDIIHHLYNILNNALMMEHDKKMQEYFPKNKEEPTNDKRKIT